MSEPDKKLQEIYNRSLKRLHTEFTSGQKVSGTVLSITRDFVFVDINAISDGIIERRELEKDGKLRVKAGDTITAFFLGIDDTGEYNLTVQLKSRDTADDTLLEAQRSGIPVEGRVEAERKGGYEVKIGNRSGFCPYSQIDMFPSNDKTLYIGQRFSFLITECDDFNMVVSRRRLLEAEHEKTLKSLQENLKVGDVIEGTVKRIMDFGIFVDIGGMEGLVPMAEISWSRAKKAEEIVTIGEKVAVKVYEIDWPRNRIGLSLRQMGGDPWRHAEANYHPTKRYRGTVTKTLDFGAFIELEPGIEGLIHISKLGAGKRLQHAREVLHEGQEIEVYVDTIDMERRRISLTLENPQQGRTMEVEGEKVTVGETIIGTVEEIRPFGVFIKLNTNQTGLLHVSEIPFTGSVNKMKDMHKRYPLQGTVTVIVKAVHQDRISLTLPESSGENDSEFRQFLVNSDSQQSLGSLAGALSSLKL